MPALLSQDPVSTYTQHSDCCCSSLTGHMRETSLLTKSVAFQCYLVGQTGASCHSFNPSDYFPRCDYFWNTFYVQTHTLMTWLQLKLSNTFTAEYHYLQVGYSLLNLLTYCDNMPRYTRLYEIVKMEPVVKQTVFFF